MEVRVAVPKGSLAVEGVRSSEKGRGYLTSWSDKLAGYATSKERGSKEED